MNFHKDTLRLIPDWKLLRRATNGVARRPEPPSAEISISNRFLFSDIKFVIPDEYIWWSCVLENVYSPADICWAWKSYDQSGLFTISMQPQACKVWQTVRLLSFQSLHRLQQNSRQTPIASCIVIMARSRNARVLCQTGNCADFLWILLLVSIESYFLKYAFLETKKRLITIVYTEMDQILFQRTSSELLENKSF